MNISKTLFKNLTRCSNFPALYNMYINRTAHDVKEIDGYEIKKLLDEVSGLESDIFNEVDEQSRQIFSKMFNEEDGEDLTEVTSAQLEAFADIYVEVERLAMEQAKRMFGNDLIASTNTFEQKSFSFTDNDNTYYCYLDGYLENDTDIHIFEVKTSTSRKYDLVDMNGDIENNNKESLPVFIKNSDGIMRFVGYDYIGLPKSKNKCFTKEDVDKKIINFYNRNHDLGKYIFDLSVERYIVEHSIGETNKNIHYYLVLLNSEYIFDGIYIDGVPSYDRPINGHELFKIYDLTDITMNYQEDIDTMKNKLEYDLNHLNIKYNRFSPCCGMKKTHQCKFFPICASKAMCDGSVIEYLDRKNAFPTHGRSDKNYYTIYDLFNNKCFKIEDSREYIEKIKNVIQYDCYMENKTYFDKTRISKAIKSLKYPLYHLDFESYNCPLPRYKGEKPYMQSLFQYSLHIEKEPGVCDIVADHLEYLAPDHNDRREEFIVKMIHDIDLSKGGYVIVYNESFEKTRLKECARMFPKYRKELMNIHDHVWDLCYVLKGNTKFFEPICTPDELENKPGFTYYHNNLHGSFSIKKVLPIFTNLTYKNLEVKNGTEAILTYGQLKELTDLEYENKYKALRIYCRQDTWAMVEILRGLRKEIE